MSEEPALPLVTTADQGGVHDTTSYTAGFEMGCLDAELRALANLASCRHATLRCHVHAENLKQADLIAMAYGLTMTVVDTGRNEHCEWASVDFTTMEGI